MTHIDTLCIAIYRWSFFESCDRIHELYGWVCVDKRNYDGTGTMEQAKSSVGYVYSGAHFDK